MYIIKIFWKKDHFPQRQSWHFVGTHPRRIWNTAVQLCTPPSCSCRWCQQPVINTTQSRVCRPQLYSVCVCFLFRTFDDLLFFFVNDIPLCVYLYNNSYSLRIVFRRSAWTVRTSLENTIHIIDTAINTILDEIVPTSLTCDGNYRRFVSFNVAYSKMDKTAFCWMKKKKRCTQ